MMELSDWIWLIVAGIWVVTRILPRLFRSKSNKGPPAQPRQSPAGGAPPPKMERQQHSRPGSYLPSFEGLGRSKGGQPPPIEPK